MKQVNPVELSWGMDDLVGRPIFRGVCYSFQGGYFVTLWWTISCPVWTKTLNYSINSSRFVLRITLYPWNMGDYGCKCVCTCVWKKGKQSAKCNIQQIKCQHTAIPQSCPHRVGGRDGWRSLLGCSLRSRWPSIYQNHSKSMSLLTLKDKSTRGNISSSIIIMLLTTNKTNITVVSCCFFNIITHCLPSFGGHHNIMANEIHPLKTNKNNFRVPSYEKMAIHS